MEFLPRRQSRGYHHEELIMVPFFELTTTCCCCSLWAHLHIYLTYLLLPICTTRKTDELYEQVVKECTVTRKGRQGLVLHDTNIFFLGNDQFCLSFSSSPCSVSFIARNRILLLSSKEDETEFFVIWSPLLRNGNKEF